MIKFIFQEQPKQNHERIRVTAEIRLKYQHQLEQASWFERWMIKWKIRKEVDRILSRSLYGMTPSFTPSNDPPKM